MELRRAPSRRPSPTSTRAPSATPGYILDPANGGISLLQTDNITPEAWAAVEAAKAGIAAGSIASRVTPTQAEVEALYAAN